jgi:hypothetical protein
MKQAVITRLIADRRFGEASALLRRHLREAEILDPRRDDSWGIDADILGYAVLEHRGAGEFAAYWKELLEFFLTELEPEWGHLHKGHIYLRLAAGRLEEDLEEAASLWKRGLAEDRLVAESRLGTDPGLDVEETVRDSPANAALCTALIVDRWPFASTADKRRFFAALAPIRFDVIWGPQEVDPRRVRRALVRILGRNSDTRPLGLATVLETREELDRVFDARLGLATMRMVETSLQALLREQLPATGSRGKPVETASPPAGPWPAVGPSPVELLDTCERAGILPVGQVPTIFRLALILGRLFPLLSSLQIDAELTPRVVLQLAVMVKILVDGAIVRWSEAL